MHSDNLKAINYFDKIERNLENYPEHSDGINLGTFTKDEIRLAQTGKGARMDARIKALKRGQEFDESQTPPEELENLDQELMGEIVNRNVEDLFKE